VVVLKSAISRLTGGAIAKLVGQRNAVGEKNRFCAPSSGSRLMSTGRGQAEPKARPILSPFLSEGYGLTAL
jgi:hypothetical protein